MATLAAFAGWTTQEIANLIIARRRQHNEEPEKALRPDYIQRTVERALTTAQSRTNGHQAVRTAAGASLGNGSTSSPAPNGEDDCQTRIAELEQQLADLQAVTDILRQQNQHHRAMDQIRRELMANEALSDQEKLFLLANGAELVATQNKAERDGHYRVRVAHLAKPLGWKPGKISRCTGELEKRGLLSKRRHSIHDRATDTHSTDLFIRASAPTVAEWWEQAASTPKVHPKPKKVPRRSACPSCGGTDIDRVCRSCRQPVPRRMPAVPRPDQADTAEPGSAEDGVNSKNGIHSPVAQSPLHCELRIPGAPLLENTQLTEAGTALPGQNGTNGTARNGAARLDPLLSSASVEWYTPTHILERVRTVLGEIDLDPCSNSQHGPNVPAARQFTKEDDGLARPWQGRVFMNPPYGRRVIDPWPAKLRAEYEAGRVTAAIALLPARTETRWWQVLKRFPRCFVQGRLKFSRPDGRRGGAPFPSALVYLGPGPDRFAVVFADLGEIVNVPTWPPSEVPAKNGYDPCDADPETDLDRPQKVPVNDAGPSQESPIECWAYLTTDDGKRARSDPVPIVRTGFDPRTHVAAWYYREPGGRVRPWPKDLCRPIDEPGRDPPDTS